MKLIKASEFKVGDVVKMHPTPTDAWFEMVVEKIEPREGGAVVTFFRPYVLTKHGVCHAAFERFGSWTASDSNFVLIKRMYVPPTKKFKVMRVSHYNGDAVVMVKGGFPDKEDAVAVAVGLARQQCDSMPNDPVVRSDEPRHWTVHMGCLKIVTFRVDEY